MRSRQQVAQGPTHFHTVEVSSDRNQSTDFYYRQFAETAYRLARTLYLLPAVAAALALATPIADLRLPSRDDEPKTLVGVVGEFADLRSAVGVRPVVVLTLVAVLVILGAALIAAVSTRPPDSGGKYARIQPGPVITTASVALILLVVPLLVTLGAADHAANSLRHAPFTPLLGGVGMLLLTGVAGIIVAHTERKVR